MDIVPFRHGEKWILAVGVGAIKSNTITGSRQQRATRVAFRACWSSEKGRWSGQSVFGTQFDSSDDALNYLAENRDIMESAPGL